MIATSCAVQSAQPRPDTHLDILGKVPLATGDDRLAASSRCRCALFGRHSRGADCPRPAHRYLLVELLGRDLFNFGAAAASGVRCGAIRGCCSRCDLGRGRHVARTLHDPRHQPLPRFPGVVWGTITQRCGTGRSGSAPSGCSSCRSSFIRLLPVISIFETKKSAPRA